MIKTLMMLGGLGAAAYYLSDPKRREMLMRKADALKGPISDLADRAASMMQQAKGLTPANAVSSPAGTSAGLPNP